MQTICQLHEHASALQKQGIHVISSDEMTGIQALERAMPTQPMTLGQAERREFEYIRHGTLSLIANWDVAQGQVVCPSLGPTRTEYDFANHIARTIETAPDDAWIFLVDQLNTHQSASLVRLVTVCCQLEADLDRKGQSGILQSMQTRAAFLAEPTHRIRFVHQSGSIPIRPNTPLGSIRLSAGLAFWCAA